MYVVEFVRDARVIILRDKPKIRGEMGGTWALIIVFDQPARGAQVSFFKSIKATI